MLIVGRILLGCGVGFANQMVNIRTDADLYASVQNALQTLLPQIRAEIQKEFRTSSGPSNSGGNTLPVTIHTWLERFKKQKPHPFEKATAPFFPRAEQERLKRNHSHNNDCHGSDRRGGSNNHRSSNNNYSGNNNRETGVSSPTDMPILVPRSLWVPLRATPTRFALRMDADTQESVVELLNTTATTSGQADKKPSASGRVFAITEDHATKTSGTIIGTLFIYGHAVFMLFDTGDTHSVISSAFASRITTAPTLLDHIISALQARTLLSHGYEGFLATIHDTTSDVPFIHDQPIVSEFPDVFLDELPGIPLVREVEINIELIPRAEPISKAPYR
nr:putative reverse transcriptase domain-containing protein [Tanacetum cinerariifolium]